MTSSKILFGLLFNDFLFQICGLVILLTMSWLVVSLVTMVAPVWLGRKLFSLFMSNKDVGVYELYTAAIGIYVFILSIKAVTLVSGWIQQGWAQMSKKMKEWIFVVSIKIRGHMI